MAKAMEVVRTRRAKVRRDQDKAAQLGEDAAAGDNHEENQQ